jgi:hypothetical protein
MNLLQQPAIPSFILCTKGGAGTLLVSALSFSKHKITFLQLSCIQTQKQNGPMTDMEKEHVMKGKKGYKERKKVIIQVIWGGIISHMLKTTQTNLLTPWNTFVLDKLTGL